jgi:hypothetical protein
MSRGASSFLAHIFSFQAVSHKLHSHILSLRTEMCVCVCVFVETRLVRTHMEWGTKNSLSRGYNFLCTDHLNVPPSTMPAYRG